MIMFPASTPWSAPKPAPPRPAADYGPGSAAAKSAAKRLETIAERHGPDARGRQLRSLAAALRDPAEAGLWRGVPIHDAFAGLAPEAPDRRRDAVTQTFAVLRAIAVFLPLLVSWWGIHGAVAAYGDRLESDPDQGAQAFFRDWLSGFDGRLWLSFDRMALIVVLCIIGLIAVSIAAELFQRTVAAAAAQAASELDYALTEAALHLQALPHSDPDDVQRQLTDMVAHAADVVEALNEAVTAVRVELEGLRDSTGEFRSVVTGLQNGAFAIADATARLDTTVSGEQQRAAKAFQDAGTVVADQVAAAAQAIQTGSTDLQQQALQLLAQVGQAVADAVGQGERNRDAIGLLMRDGREEDARALADAIAQRQSELADELRRAGEDIAGRITSTVDVGVDQPLRQQLHAVQLSNQQLHTTLDALARAVEFLGQQMGTEPANLPEVQRRRAWYHFGR